MARVVKSLGRNKIVLNLLIYQAFPLITTLNTIHSHSLDLQKSICDTIRKKDRGCSNGDSKA
jgi:hypothetical protein